MENQAEAEQQIPLAKYHPSFNVKRDFRIIFALQSGATPTGLKLMTFWCS